jgi:alpha-acetolactate decarboxylase
LQNSNPPVTRRIFFAIGAAVIAFWRGMIFSKKCNRPGKHLRFETDGRKLIAHHVLMSIEDLKSEFWHRALILRKSSLDKHLSQSTSRV